jgi:hypothetical protein
MQERRNPTTSESWREAIPLHEFTSAVCQASEAGLCRKVSMILAIHISLT